MRLSPLAVASLLVLAGPGCSMGSMYNSGDFGATQGGVQDMGLAREMIAAGVVPPPEAFVVEGMFSEHDLGVTGAPCEAVLCLRGAGGIAPDATGAERGWVQVGMSSTIDPERFERPSQTIVAVVDISGSMAWDWDVVDAYDTAGHISRHLLHAIADELGPEDQIAIVTYGSRVHTALDFTEGGGDRVHDAIDDLGTGGSTNMEAGLERAYRLATNADFGTDEKRVMVFTDVQPNVGMTEGTEFEQMAADAAAEGVGTTVFAMGVGMGQEVMLGMSHLRGGNAFSLFDNEDADALMADSWPWMVSPIAYDLRVALDPGVGFAVSDAYGFPASADGEEAADLEVATVFLSRRKGAMLVGITPDEGASLDALSVTGELSYVTPEGQPMSTTIDVSAAGAARDERGHWYAQGGVARTLALALLVEGMRDAAIGYSTDPVAAATQMTAVADRFRADASALGDDDLLAEVALADALVALMVAQAPQTDLYGWSAQDPG